MTRLNKFIRFGLALLSAGALLLPSGALAAPAGQPATGIHIDTDLAQQVATSAPQTRLPVLVEASGTPGVDGPTGNERRANDVDGAVRRTGGALRGHLNLVGAVAADLTPAQMQQLATDRLVAHLSLDRPVRASSLYAAGATASGTPITYQQTIGATSAAQQGFTGSGVGVAVIDTGIASNPALSGRVVKHVDFVDPTSPAGGDPAGHGTHLAGIIAAHSAALTGVAPDASLVDVRVLDAQGNGRLSSVIKGLEWTVLHRKQLGIHIAVLALTNLPALADASTFCTRCFPSTCLTRIQRL